MQNPNPIEIKRGQKTVDRIQAHIAAKRKTSAQPTTVTAGLSLDGVDAQQAQVSGSTSDPDTCAE